MSNTCFIIPVFNAAKYIPQFFKNVVEISSNEVFVFVNDGSFDNSLIILQNAAENNKNVYIVDKTVNEGQSVARNDGIDFVLSLNQSITHVGFLDIDDTVTPDYFCDLDCLDLDKVYVKTFCSVSSRGDLVLDNHFDIDRFNVIMGHDFLELLVLWKATVSACNKIMPIETLPRFVEDTKEEDTIFMFDLACRNPIFVKSGYGSYKYHRHEQTSTAIVDIRLFDLFYVLMAIKEILCRANKLLLFSKFRRYWLNVVLSDRLSKASFSFRFIVLCAFLFDEKIDFGMKQFLWFLLKSSYLSMKRKLANEK